MLKKSEFIISIAYQYAISKTSQKGGEKRVTAKSLLMFSDKYVSEPQSAFLLLVFFVADGLVLVFGQGGRTAGSPGRGQASALPSRSRLPLTAASFVSQIADGSSHSTFTNTKVMATARANSLLATPLRSEMAGPVKKSNQEFNIIILSRLFLNFSIHKVSAFCDQQGRQMPPTRW